MEPRAHRHSGLGNLAPIFRTLWADFLREPIDQLPNTLSLAAQILRNAYFKWEWYRVYDFIEFVAENCEPSHSAQFVECCNRTLEKEMTGYRLAGSKVTPITDIAELHAIEEALQTTQALSLVGAREHLSSALAKLSDRKQPDYRNSIKESISAVEAVAQLITDNPKATLGDALKVIDARIPLHPALAKGFSSIYGYTNDADGIRHALLETPQSDFEDAKYMLVSCAGFVSYLIAKAIKAGRSF